MRAAERRAPLVPEEENEGRRIEWRDGGNGTGYSELIIRSAASVLLENPGPKREKRDRTPTKKREIAGVRLSVVCSAAGSAQIITGGHQVLGGPHQLL